MNQSSKKTLQILGNSAFGGATRLVIDWCLYLRQQGCSVYVLTTDQRTIESFSSIEGVHIFNQVLIPRDIDVIRDIRALLKLAILLRREKFDVVHTYSATPGFIGRLAAFMAGVPSILHHQAGWTVNEAKSLFGKYLYEVLESIAVAVSTKSICVSHAVRKQADSLSLMPKSKLVTVCNGIEAERFILSTSTENRANLCQQFSVSPEAILLGNTGRLAAQKDNSTLIQAVADLKKISPEKDFKLFLVGDGPERAELQDLTASLNVSKDVLFLGFRSDIPEFLSALDVFVSPSLWEGLSISILEAMAASKPIVATNIMPNQELIEHEQTGLLVDTHAPAQIAEAVLRFLDDPKLARTCGQNARERVLESYTLERMFSETFQLYQ